MHGESTNDRSETADQAAGLRRASVSAKEGRIAPLPSRHSTRVISVTSGKGGVGKTNLVVNLAIALANLGRSVLVLDADLGLANVDIMLGLQVRHTLHEVVCGTKRIDDVMLTGPSGISIIPSASGVERLAHLTDAERLSLLQEVERVAGQYDYLLIDTQAGIGADVMQLNAASHEVLCVANPEPTSMTDAYAVIKLLAKSYGERQVSIISTRVTGKSEGLQLFKKLQQTVERFLQIDLKYRGCVPSDSHVTESVRRQQAVVELFPSCPSALAYSGIARDVDADFSSHRVKGGMQFFFNQLLECSGS